MHELIDPALVPSMTDEEFKQAVVRSYNRCAEEHKIYKRALEKLRDGSAAQVALMEPMVNASWVNAVARDALERRR